MRGDGNGTRTKKTGAIPPEVQEVFSKLSADCAGGQPKAGGAERKKMTVKCVGKGSCDWIESEIRRFEKQKQEELLLREANQLDLDPQDKEGLAVCEALLKARPDFGR